MKWWRSQMEVKEKEKEKNKKLWKNLNDLINSEWADIPQILIPRCWKKTKPLDVKAVRLYLKKGLKSESHTDDSSVL